MKYTQRLSTIICVLFVFAMHGFAAPQPIIAKGFLETHVARSIIEKEWLTGELGGVSFLSETRVENRFGDEFIVSQKREETFLVITIQDAKSSGVQGRWSLYRSLSTGLGEKVVIYPSDDPSIYITIYPSPSALDLRTSLDFSLYGMKVTSRAPIPLSFDIILTSPVSKIMYVTQNTVPWHLLQSDPLVYREVFETVSVLRSRLSTLVYLDDGAFDENGRAIYIADGRPQIPAAIRSEVQLDQDPLQISGGVNCSGFAKWVVDGGVRPIAGSNLKIEPLKKNTDTPSTHFTEYWRDIRDQFFGLDWIRNLASAWQSVRLRRTLYANETGVDVTVEPFAGSTGYEPNVGYPGGEIIPYLYYLAATEPGHYYLGVVNRERTPVDTAPVLREYHHIAVFFPYFSEEGQFQLSIFESGVETHSAVFVSRNLDAYIHLVRLRIPESGYFFP